MAIISWEIQLKKNQLQCLKQKKTNLREMYLMSKDRGSNVVQEVRKFSLCTPTNTMSNNYNSTHYTAVTVVSGL